MTSTLLIAIALVIGYVSISDAKSATTVAGKLSNGTLSPKPKSLMAASTTNSTHITNSTYIQEILSKIKLNTTTSGGRSMDGEVDDPSVEYSRAATKLCRDTFMEDPRWRCPHFAYCCNAACSFYREPSDFDCVLGDRRPILKCICIGQTPPSADDPDKPGRGSSLKEPPKSEISKSCGVSSVKPEAGRIYGGQEAVPHSWPWQVSIRQESGDMRHICGGSIVDETHILTAAHCFESAVSNKPDAKDFRVAVGLHDVNQLYDGVVYGVSTIRIHPNRNRTRKSYDYAVLRLSQPLAYSESAMAICLPTEQTANPSECVATGWGKTETKSSSSKLLQVQLPIIDQSICNDINHYNGRLDGSMFCASSEGKDACQGDSGGPLVCKREDGSWELQGITSWSDMGNCGKIDTPGVFAKVTYVTGLDWIQKNLRS